MVNGLLVLTLFFSQHAYSSYKLFVRCVIQNFELRAGCPNLGHATLRMYKIFYSQDGKHCSRTICIDSRRVFRSRAGYIKFPTLYVFPHPFFNAPCPFPHLIFLPTASISEGIQIFPRYILPLYISFPSKLDILPLQT